MWLVESIRFLELLVGESQIKNEVDFLGFLSRDQFVSSDLLYNQSSAHFQYSSAPRHHFFP